MAEGIQSTPDNAGVQSTPLSAGQGLPMFAASGRPSPFKLEDMNRLVRAINNFLKLKVNVASNVSVDGTVQTPFGVLTLSDDGGALNLYLSQGTSAGGASSTPMTIVSEQDNYLTCTNAASATVYVAKPYLLQRATYDGKTFTLFDGLAHTFSYAAKNQRADTVTIASVSATPVVFNQLIFSQYIAGQILMCDQPAGGTGLTGGDSLPITWQDTNEDARDWATEFTACQLITISGTPTATSGYQLIKGSDFYLSSIG